MTNINVYSTDEILGQLALACYRAGGVRKWSSLHNCTHSTVSRVLKGTSPVTPGIAKILGIQPSEPIYCKIGDPEPTGSEMREFMKKVKEKRSKKSKV